METELDEGTFEVVLGRVEPQILDFGNAPPAPPRLISSSQYLKAFAFPGDNPTPDDPRFRDDRDTEEISPDVQAQLQRIAEAVVKNGGDLRHLLRQLRHMGYRGDKNAVSLRDCEEAFQNAQPEEDNPRPRVWRATDMAPSKPKRWLAKNRLPYEAVVILVGDEGIGKSLFWVWIVAAVTTGRPAPEFGIPHREAQHVRLVLTEDSWPTEVRPRLEAAGADLNYISIIAARRDGSGTPIFPDDNSNLYEKPVPALIVVDAWIDTTPGDVNVQSPQGARQVLHPWKDVTSQTGAAVLLLVHTNRSNASSARDKYGVTSELRKKARLTLYAQSDSQGQLLVGPEKANGASLVPASIFAVDVLQVRPSTDDDDGTVARLKYVGESSHTARVHASQEAVKPEVEWLCAYLADGMKPARAVMADGVERGFAPPRLRAAAKELGVEFSKNGYQGQGCWALP